MSVKMTYKGVEIESIDTPQIFDLPKRMVTWCYCNGKCYDVREQDVVAILPPLPGHASVICRTAATVRWAAYCAEIPEAPKPRRAIWKELAYWLMDGCGLVMDKDTDRVGTGVLFNKKNICEEVGKRWLVMRKDDTEWHEPTVDYMGIGG